MLVKTLPQFREKPLLSKPCPPTNSASTSTMYTIMHEWYTFVNQNMAPQKWTWCQHRGMRNGWLEFKPLKEMKGKLVEPRRIELLTS